MTRSFALPSSYSRGFALIAIGAVLGAAFAGYGGYLPRIETATAQEAQPVNGTLFDDHIAQAAMPACEALYPQMGALLTDGASYAVQTRWHAIDPERQAVQSIVGLNFDTPQHSGPAAGYVYAAPSGSACSGSVLRVTPVEADCASLATALVSAPAELSQLESISVYAFETGEQLALLPFGTACVAVSSMSLSGI